MNRDQFQMATRYAADKMREQAKADLLFVEMAEARLQGMNENTLVGMASAVEKLQQERNQLARYLAFVRQRALTILSRFRDARGEDPRAVRFAVANG